VRIYCVGFGDELDPTQLQAITAGTQGSYYTATNPADLALQFALVGDEVQGNYLLRWATLKRSSAPFMPTFQITYQGFTANSPINPVVPPQTNIDNSTTPPTTNVVPASTNIVIPFYVPTQYASPGVTVGSLRLVPDADVAPQAVTLRATYVPRYIRQIQLHYRANWPCLAALQNTNVGQMLYNWTMTQTNGTNGDFWLLASSPYPQSITNSIPFADFGDLIKFSLRDMITSSNAFSIFTNDNSLYVGTGGQTFTLTNVTPFITFYTNLPHSTPIPWLLANGFTNNLAAAELSDPDNDGIPTWQEYQANTDPHDPNSKFVMQPVSRAVDGRYQITFSTSTNRTYQVDTSADLINWQILADGIPGINTNVTFIDTRYLPGSPAIFYRILAY
jgi:hypothetical protein